MKTAINCYLIGAAFLIAALDVPATAGAFALSVLVLLAFVHNFKA